MREWREEKHRGEGPGGGRRGEALVPLLVPPPLLSTGRPAKPHHRRLVPLPPPRPIDPFLVEFCLES